MRKRITSFSMALEQLLVVRQSQEDVQENNNKIVLCQFCYKTICKIISKTIKNEMVQQELMASIQNNQNNASQKANIITKYLQSRMDYIIKKIENIPCQNGKVFLNWPGIDQKKQMERKLMHESLQIYKQFLANYPQDYNAFKNKQKQIIRYFTNIIQYNLDEYDRLYWPQNSPCNIYKSRDIQQIDFKFLDDKDLQQIKQARFIQQRASEERVMNYVVSNNSIRIEFKQRSKNSVRSNTSLQDRLY